MVINGTTSLYGIIGKPVEHTISPMIHNTISERMGIDSVYVPFRTDGNLSDTTRGLYSLGVRGINVTVPYKTKIIEHLCAVEPLAAAIGAVNTLKYTDEGYCGYNTDISGLGRELDSEAISVKGRKVIILGAGGAARAAAFMCLERKPKSIVIANRTLQKAEQICKDLEVYACSEGYEGEAAEIKAVTTESLTGAGSSGLIVFQCTNVGLSPNDGDCVINDRDFYGRVAEGIDLIYKPAQTMFMKNVKEAGGRAYNGLKMLIYQAVCSYEIWNGVRVPEEIVDEIEIQLSER